MKVLTLNIWQEQGPWRQRMEAIQRQVRRLAPDVVCLQEVRQAAERIPNQAEMIAATLGFGYRYAVAQPWGDGEEGLAILARAEICEDAFVELPWEGSQTRRICLGIALEPRRASRVWVFTTHLAYRPADGALRERQVVALDGFVRSTAQDNVAIVAGDFNAVPEADEIRFMCGLTALQGHRTYYQDAFARSNPGDPGWTWCTDNPYTDPLSWLPRDRRLDYIFVSAQRRDGTARVNGSRIVCREVEPDGIRCSDHYGLIADIEAG